MRNLSSILLFVLGTAVTGAAQPGEQRPNVVILFADDLGYGDLGCQGAGDIPTPHLDAMAAEGARFTSFYVAASVCTPSRAALLTGCYPVRTGLSRVLHPHETRGLGAETVTVAECLREAGYATACFGKWHLGHAEPFLPQHHGFAETLIIPYSHDMYRGAPWGSPSFTCSWPDHIPLFRLGEKVAELRGREDFATLTRLFTDAGCDFIERHAGGRFFLYLPLTLPHLELLAPEEWRGKSKRGPYGDAVAELDDAAGRILATLKKTGIDDKTLVIFTSDNGPAKIYQQPAFPGGSAGPFSGGKNTAFEGGFRVPCLMRWPGRIPAGRTCGAMCSAMDLFPALAALAGARLPETPIDGRNILPLMLNPHGGASPHQAFLYYKDETPLAIRSGDYKLWLPGTPANKNAAPRLYLLSEDPAEQKDLRASAPGVVTRLAGLANRLAGKQER